MTPSTTDATIYLAGLRGCTQNEWFRSYHTVNFESYQVESRRPWGSIVAVNDDTLKEGHTMVHSFREDTMVILLPIVGEMTYTSSVSLEGSVNAGQARVLYLPADSTLEISNPYRAELINFLQLWLTVPDDFTNSARIYATDFDWLDKSNQLINLHAFTANNDNQKQISIGNYQGRKGGIYSLKDEQKGVFVFVIEGAFEVQDRLLQPRDSLRIWNTSELDYEALSNGAILLIVDL